MTDPTAALSRPLAEIAAELDASEAEAVRGEAMPLEPVLDQIRASIARMETRRSNPSAHARKA